jgi:hypothetical protein
VWAVHHIDPDLDVSTGFRFHFGEVLLSTLFRVVQVSLIGISLATFANIAILADPSLPKTTATIPFMAVTISYRSGE